MNRLLLKLAEKNKKLLQTIVCQRVLKVRAAKTRGPPFTGVFQKMDLNGKSSSWVTKRRSTWEELIPRWKLPEFTTKYPSEQTV